MHLKNEIYSVQVASRNQFVTCIQLKHLNFFLIDVKVVHRHEANPLKVVSMKKGRGKGKTSGVMLNWLFCLAVVSLLARLWVRGEKMWDVESDTLE